MLVASAFKRLAEKLCSISCSDLVEAAAFRLTGEDGEIKWSSPWPVSIGLVAPCGDSSPPPPSSIRLRVGGTVEARLTVVVCVVTTVAEEDDEDEEEEEEETTTNDGEVGDGPGRSSCSCSGVVGV